MTTVDELTRQSRLDAMDLRWRCDPASLGFATTDELAVDERIYGQEDAVEALRYGLETRVHGHNVFVRGLSGFGRMSLVRQVIEEIKPHCAPAPDRCYVHNFGASDQARLITLASGRGKAFCAAMDHFVHFVEQELAQFLTADRIKARQRHLEEKTRAEIKRAGDPFDAELQQAGLAMVPMQVGPNIVPVILPVINGKPHSYEDLRRLRAEGSLSEPDFQALMDKIALYESKVADVGQTVAELQARHREAMAELVRREAQQLIEGRISQIRSDFPGADVATFLDEVTRDILDERLADLSTIGPFCRNYRVNLILSHREGDTAPVISETNPTLVNLVGRVEREFIPNHQFALSDHLMIKPGSLLEADGGFLILDAQDILMEPGAWTALLRTLKTGFYELSNLDPFGIWAIPQLKPEPIPVNIKVVLVGDPEIFYLLDHLEPRFPTLFKILADFSDTLSRDANGIAAYAKVIARIVSKDRLPPFSASGVARLVEHGARICGQQDRLTSKFARIADITREAAYIATRDHGNKATVDAADVREAIRRSKRRAGIPARNFRRLIVERTLKIEVSGERVGQINGLAVTQAGPMTYGFPARITASIGPGSAGAINIERESDLSGALHTKAFHILSGLMRHLLKLEHPLAFSASIAFEQTYGGIDGDSASGAEFCCLISALTEAPIRQNLAMTGAIDQKGNILPIGAATEKIEGFYDACRALGLNGAQGVLIPRTNARELMLREDVMESVSRGEFHVYAVATVQEALTLLTGVAAGERGPNGYPQGTLLGLAELRAAQYWEGSKGVRF